MLKSVAEFSPGFCVVVFHGMLALVPFPVFLRAYTLVTLGP
jgi:hypothetical protein